MFGYGRRFPWQGLALIGLGILLASTWGAVGSTVGFLLVLPLLILKFLFIMFLIGFGMRLLWGRGPRRGPWGRGPVGRGPWGGRWTERNDRVDDGSEWWYRGRPMAPPRPGPFQPQDPEVQDWEESLRQARHEVEEAERRSGSSDR